MCPLGLSKRLNTHRPSRRRTHANRFPKLFQNRRERRMVKIQFVKYKREQCSGFAHYLIFLGRIRVRYHIVPSFIATTDLSDAHVLWTFNGKQF